MQKQQKNPWMSKVIKELKPKQKHVIYRFQDGHDILAALSTGLVSLTVLQCYHNTTRKERAKFYHHQCSTFTILDVISKEKV